ncbi:MAG: hypothetical protein AB7I42_23985 [Bradyrhizobium sp.]|uniref:hypothetical protein n=1 Tax=Bradyrhizobium sp. TaxID=376 RepID=UPI003D0A0163
MSTLLIASDPTELVTAQNALIADVDAKRTAAIEEATAAHDMVESAKRGNISVAAAKTVHRRASSRVGYLTKIGQALRAGFVMMPDMPGDVVAVRVDRDAPSVAARRLYDWKSNIPGERSDSLPPGKGRYVSPSQGVHTQKVQVKKSDGSIVSVDRHCAIELRNPDGLDRRFVRPEVMTRLAAAMTMKLFDEVVCIRPQSTKHRRSKDPIVLGRIIDKATKTTSAFLIAWFMDKRDI